MSSITDRSFIFGRWVLQSDGLLLCEGNAVHLPPKELHVLRLLLEAAGSLVTKDWLLSQVWPNHDVAEESLTRCIYTLRKLLGRDYIQTAYGKGYRFVGEVVGRADVSPVPASSAPSLLVLPLLVQGDSCGVGLQGKVVGQLASAFGGSLCVVPARLTADPQVADDCLAMIERVAPSYYLSVRCVVRGGRWALSVELARGCDHALLHSETQVAIQSSEELLQYLVSMVAQRLPGLRPAASRCSSYPLALAYLDGLLGLQEYTARSLDAALAKFYCCLQLDDRYAPPWCGVADTYLAQASLGLRDGDKAFARARQAVARALALEPGNAAATVRLALLTSLQGAHEAAEALFRPALLGGDRAVTYYYYAWHHWCSGGAGQALKSMETALADDPASVAARLLHARISVELGPQLGLAAIRTAIAVLGEGHEVIDAMHALVLDVCGDPEGALVVLAEAGLLGAPAGEAGLIGCYVLAASDPAAARRQYERWRAASDNPPLCPGQLAVLRRVEGDFRAARLWRELEVSACPWRRARLADPRLRGLAELRVEERLQA